MSEKPTGLVARLLPGAMPWWGITARGLCMGAADVVPGVSGGTMALVLGIYERFIGSLGSIDLALVKSLPKLFGAKREEAFTELRRADIAFLVFLALGIGTAILSASKLIPWLIDHYPAHMNALFFGMIVASVAVPFKMMQRHGVVEAINFVLMTAFAWWFSGLSVLEIQMPLPALFVCGTVAICAMMLPGISGSFLLLILGQYKYVLSALRDLNIPVIVVFGGGCVFGLLAFSRVLRWLLAKFPSPTLAALCGLMVGSLQKIWPYKDYAATELVGEKVVSSGVNVWPWSERFVTDPFFPAALLVLGAVVVIVLERFGAAKSH